CRRGEMAVRAVPPRDLCERLLADSVPALLRQATRRGLLDEALVVETAVTATAKIGTRSEARPRVSDVRGRTRFRGVLGGVFDVWGNHGERGHRSLLQLRVGTSRIG